MKIFLIYEKLLSSFGPQNWWPVTENGNKFEIIAGAILTQNTNWKNVEKALKNLRERNLLSKNAIGKIPEKELAGIIRSSGYHNQKARKLKSFVNFRDRMTRENLLKIWGIGRETADSILLYAYDKPYFVIDAYTIRIMQRLGFQAKNYDEWQELFHKSLPKDHKLYNEFHALFVALGKNVCGKEPLCGKCPLAKGCEYAKKNENG
ncbi:MAG: endonuclease [Candidatus Aenigmarchaeota archaeon]|nr:endonuclease [Candidatus Aenigmarchaeota archaeon]MDI6722388.1 endonuclease [Candidatus Aenigmarchaeota archaeon]